MTDKEMQCKYLMPFKRSILYMTEQELLNAHLDAVECYGYNINNGFEASAEMNMYQACVYVYAMGRVKQ